MAVCVGCGLEVVNGILEVAVCPNGGVQCATQAVPGPGGCTNGLYIKFPPNIPGGSDPLLPIGCGLSTNASGQIQVDPCTNGGILCGATDDDPEDNCVYVNVQGQGGAVCVPFANANEGVNGSDAGPHVNFDETPNGDPGSSNLSPNCNGLVRTCDGLWSPPKIPSINFNCAAFQMAGDGTLGSILFNKAPENGNFGGPYASDLAFGDGAGRIINFNSFTGDPCLPIDAMSFTTFSVSFFVKAGERWRFTLFERICNPADLGDNTQCDATPWSEQASQFLDRTGTAGGVETVQFNDISTWDFPAGTTNWRMEAIVLANRLVGAGAIDNALNGVALFQYRNMGHGYHKSVPKNCGTTGI